MYPVFTSFAPTDALSLLFCLSIAHFAYRYYHRRLLPLPPGPKRWPIFGNALSIPLTNLHVFYKELGEKLDTRILYLEALGRSILVINDIKTAQDLLDKRSLIYSSRPHLTMFMDVVNFKQLFGLLPYGDEWRAHRRIFEQYFSEKNRSSIQAKEVDFVRKSLLPNLLDAPEEYHAHVRNFVGGLSISFVYGLPIRSRNDPFVQYSEKVLNQAAGTLSPGKYLVNIMSPLKYVPGWMPGAKFKRFAAELRKELYKLLEDPFRETLKAIDNGIAPSSLVTESIERLRGRQDFDDQARYVKQTGMQVFAAFSESTTAAISTFILAMLKYPDIQRKAQEEIDSVIGLERLPEFSDISRLHYLSAVIKEVFRWNPTLPMGVPHSTDKEDIYMGYRIPKNCTVMVNAYAIFQDENVFPNPKEFRPERFLFQEKPVVPNDLPDPETLVTFGFGRRICPGAHIGLSIMYITAASILSFFDISPALDAEGRSIEVVPQFTTASLASDPLPFPCKFTPRPKKDIRDLLKEYLNVETL